jgi:dipeptidyl-peptidase 4
MDLDNRTIARSTFSWATQHLGLLLAILFALAIPQQGLGQRPASSNLPGTISAVQWDQGGETVRYTSEGQRFIFNLTTLEKVADTSEPPAETQNQPVEPSAPNRARRDTNGDSLTGKYLGRPARGRQYTQVVSPDDKWEAVYKDWNLVLIDRESKIETPITTAGNEQIHFGTASWVYGEELDQNKAIWWTADSKKVLYYCFDDSKVKQFYLIKGWSEIGTEIYPEYYPKAGAANPAASLYVYDLETAQSLRVDLGGGPDEYIYGIRSSPDGKIMLVNWTDRLQRQLKVLAIDLETGQCRTVVEEKQPNWQTNSPLMRFLSDNQRFIWPSDKTGFTHYQLRNLQGELINDITTGEFQTSTLAVDEQHSLVNFTAFSSPVNPYFLQYHLVGLDGKNQRRVTTIEAHHSNFSLSPDNKWLIAQYEEVNTPPCTALYSTDGKLVAKLAESDPTSAANLAEMFSFKSSDGQFDIYGILFKPRDFDPGKQYPVINSLYGGPGSTEIRANYVASPQGDTARGYLVVKVNNRGTGGRGKAFTDATYQRLGDVDIQDHVDAIGFLKSRPYFDGQRVGIVGHSYGGYMAAEGILKHPEVYAAAVIRAGVTDWQNYDSIYTERYMSTPQLNPNGYKTGAAMTYAKDLKGKVLIMHGMMDDNVHPNNAFQLIEALDRERKSYESRFWPNAGHGLGVGANETQQAFFDRVLKTGS